VYGLCIRPKNTGMLSKEECLYTVCLSLLIYNYSVAVTIWRLATDVEYRTISALFGIGKSTVYDIVHRTCHTMTKHLMPKYVNLPSEEKFKEITEEFETLWGFPRVVGATDGSHISILKLIKSASDYYDRKKFLFCYFTRGCGLFIDVNIPGKVHDARVFSDSTFYNKLDGFP